MSDPSIWFRGYRNLIHYSRYYNKKREITLEELELNHEKEECFLEDLKRQLDAIDKISVLVSESIYDLNTKSKLFAFVKHINEIINKKQVDSMQWLDVLEKCQTELKDKLSKDSIV